MTAATPVRSNDETGYPAGFFYLPLPQGMPAASDITVAIRKIKPIAKPDGITPEVMEAIYCPVFSSAEICPIRKARIMIKLILTMLA